MRVNSIAGTSFGRVLKIETPESTGMKSMLDKNSKVDPSVMGVVNTMRGQTSIYGEETSKKLGEFLKAQIGDYDNKTGLYARKIYGEDYLFTGEDAVRARQIVKDSIEERKQINRRYIQGPTKDSTRAERVELDNEDLHKIYIKNTFLKRDDNLLNMAENDYEENGTKIVVTFDDEAPDMAKEVSFVQPYDDANYVLKA